MLMYVFLQEKRRCCLPDPHSVMQHKRRYLAVQLEEGC